MEWTATNTLPIRQRETLVGLAQGKTTKELAKEAHVSPAAINQAVVNLANQLRLHTTKRALIVAEACARGWLQSTAALLLIAVLLQFITDNQTEFRRPPRTARVMRTVRAGRRDLKLPFDLELAA